MLQLTLLENGKHVAVNRGQIRHINILAGDNAEIVFDEAHAIVVEEKYSDIVDYLGREELPK